MAASSEHEWRCLQKYIEWKKDSRRDTEDDIAGQFFDIFCNKNVVHVLPRPVTVFGRLQKVVKTDPDGHFDIYVDDGKLAGTISPDPFFVNFCCSECAAAIDEREKSLLERSKGMVCQQCGLSVDRPSQVKFLTNKKYVLTETLYSSGISCVAPRITSSGYLVTSLFYPNFGADRSGLITISKKGTASFVCQKCQCSATTTPPSTEKVTRSKVSRRTR